MPSCQYKPPPRSTLFSKILTLSWVDRTMRTVSNINNRKILIHQTCLFRFSARDIQIYTLPWYSAAIMRACTPFTKYYNNHYWKVKKYVVSLLSCFLTFTPKWSTMCIWIPTIAINWATGLVSGAVSITPAPSIGSPFESESWCSWFQRVAGIPERGELGCWLLIDILISVGYDSQADERN